MPNALSKFTRFLGLTDEEDYYDEVLEPTPVRRVETPAPAAKVLPLSERWAANERASEIRVIEEPEAVPARIVTVNPHSFNDAKDIGEAIRRGHSVIMNLLDCDEALARRLVDYASGLTHGIDGKIDRISRGVFVISPQNVDVSELVRQTVGAPGFYNQS